MSRTVGSSILITDTLSVDLTPYRGSTGATGPTGSTGPDGNIGNTGPTGSGVYYILKNGNDGITIVLNDGTAISVKGISGNTFINDTVLPYYYKLAGSTATIPNESFEIKGTVTGLTAYFKTIKTTSGLTVNYSGNDLKFSTVASNIIIGSAGNILVGNTANVVINGPSVNAFEYQENTVGLTTVPILKGKLSNFIQRTVSTNQNIANTNTLSNLISGNTYNISFSQYKFTSGTNITNRITDNTEYARPVSGGIFRKSITTDYSLFDFTNTTTYEAYQYGSCCFCDGSGNSNCLDYVNKTYCEGTLNGTYSFKACKDRTESGCLKIGKCCVGGICVNTEYSECIRVGGTFNSGSLCSSSTC